MPEKILIPLYGNDVAPRFDLSTEVLIVTTGNKPKSRSEKMVVLSQASSERLCHLVVTESATVVICGGIEDTYYQYLTWKRVRVIDSVIGSYASVLDRYSTGSLKPGDILQSGT